MSFFKKGKAGLEANAKHEAAQEARIQQLKNTPREFFLGKGATGEILFLDDPECFLKRHTLKVGARYETITCMEEEDSGINDCPACMSGNNPAMVLACTVLSLTPYSATNGKKYQYQKQLLIVRGDSKKFLLELRQAKGSLKFCKVKVSRGTAQNSIAIGSYNFVGKLSEAAMTQLKGLLPKFIKANTEQDIPVAKYLAPFDYEKVLAPPPKDKIAAMFGMASIESYGGDADDFESVDSLDTEPEAEVGLDTDESPFGDADSNADLETSEDSDDTASDEEGEVDYASMTDSDLIKVMVDLGCREAAAKKMPKKKKLEWIAETLKEEEEADAEGDGLDDMEEKDLVAILKTEFEMPNKKIIKLEQSEMIALIRELRAEED